MKKGSKYFLLLLALLVSGCSNYPELHPVPFRRLSESLVPFPLFYACAVPKSISEAYGLYAVDEKGKWTDAPKTAKTPKAPRRPFGSIRNLFYPKTANARKNMDESQELDSPDRGYGISTYSIKTFADDLDNAYLEIQDHRTKKTEKVMVPALCNGEMFPLFWHPQKDLFYFMVSVGDDKGRSLELWEYDLDARKFQNIGDTNGDAYINKDGSWILWETGPTFHRTFPFEVVNQVPVSGGVLICAYDTLNKANYQMSRDYFDAFFQDWRGN